METIAVVFEPLGVVPGVRVQVYHETLLYTNSSGQQFLATAGPSIPSIHTTTEEIAEIVEGLIASNTGVPSILGTLATTFGSTTDLPVSVVSGLLKDTYATISVDTGANLSSEWSAITTASAQIEAAKFTYSPADQNSNSAAYTELLAANIFEPSNSGPPDSQYWTPGAGNLLSIQSASGDTLEQFIYHLLVPAPERWGVALIVDEFAGGETNNQTAKINDLTAAATIQNGPTFETSLSYDDSNGESLFFVNDNGTVTTSISLSSLGLTTIDNSLVLASTAADGDGGFDAIIGQDVTFTGTLENQILFATGQSDVLNADANNETLCSMDFGGTNILSAGTSSGISEIVFSGTTYGASDPTTGENLFSAGTGDNVLIGDGGTNTFNIGLNSTLAYNDVIWGGGTGGTSKLSDEDNAVIIASSRTEFEFLP